MVWLKLGVQGKEEPLQDQKENLGTGPVHILFLPI